MRMYGFFTAAGTCQEIRIWVRGSAPKARWRPKGVTAEPGTSVVAEDFGVAVSEPEHPVSRPPATAPAVTSARRRVSFVRAYSYCSAMLIRRASCGGIPMSGRSMALNFPAKPNTRHTYG